MRIKTRFQEAYLATRILINMLINMQVDSTRLHIFVIKHILYLFKLCCILGLMLQRTLQKNLIYFSIIQLPGKGGILGLKLYCCIDLLVRLSVMSHNKLA